MYLNLKFHSCSFDICESEVRILEHKSYPGFYLGLLLDICAQGFQWSPVWHPPRLGGSTVKLREILGSNLHRESRAFQVGGLPDLRCLMGLRNSQYPAACLKSAISSKGYAPEEPETQGWRGGRSTKAYQNFLTSKKCGGTRFFRHFGAI